MLDWHLQFNVIGYCYRSHSHIRVTIYPMPLPLIHHRGFHNWSREGNCPLGNSLPSCAENGLLAFKKAAADPNALGMEFDVQLCKNDAGDPELCIFHDETMEAIDGSNDKVADLSLREISTRVSKTNNRRFWDGSQSMSSVPSFKEMMQTLADYRGTLSIELKRNVLDLEIYLVTLMKNLPYLPKQANLIFHSFSTEMLQTIIEPIHQELPNAKFGWNFSEWNHDPDLFVRINYFYPDYELLKYNIENNNRSQILDSARNYNKLIIPWNVNTLEDYKDLELINEPRTKLIYAFISDNAKLNK